MPLGFVARGPVSDLYPSSLEVRYTTFRLRSGFSKWRHWKITNGIICLPSCILHCLYPHGLYSLLEFVNKLTYLLSLVVNGSNGNQRTLDVFRHSMVSLVPLVETLVPMVPLVGPMVPTVSY